MTWRVACLSTVIAFQHVAPAVIECGSGAFLVPGTSAAVRPWPDGVALGAARGAARNFTICAHTKLKSLAVHATMITIMRMIAEGTAFAPDLIAERFFDVATAKLDDWWPEVLFEG